MEEIAVLILKYFTSNVSKQPFSFAEISTHFKNRISASDLENSLKKLVKDNIICSETYDFQEKLTIYWTSSKPLTLKTDMDEAIEETKELENKIKILKQEVKEVETQIQLKESEYKKEYVAHLDRLHQYNDAKDAALAVIGQIASIEEVRTKDLYSRFGLELDD